MCSVNFIYGLPCNDVALQLFADLQFIPRKIFVQLTWKLIQVASVLMATKVASQIPLFSSTSLNQCFIYKNCKPFYDELFCVCCNC
jgi:hypothetical protein